MLHTYSGIKLRRARLSVRMAKASLYLTDCREILY